MSADFAPVLPGSPDYASWRPNQPSRLRRIGRLAAIGTGISGLLLAFGAGAYFLVRGNGMEYDSSTEAVLERVIDPSMSGIALTAIDGKAHRRFLAGRKLVELTGKRNTDDGEVLFDVLMGVGQHGKPAR